MITFTTTELIDFFREFKTKEMVHKHLLKTIETTRKLGIEKLEAMVGQEALKRELFEKIKLAVENTNIKIEVI